MGSPSPFDPGVVIDAAGTGWLAFGGGTMPGASEEMPGSTRIARLGKDMLSLDSVAIIPAPYFFEASEVDYIGGKYVYTLNTNWIQRNAEAWKSDAPLPAQCSMAYMTTDTPLNPDSWIYQGHYFLNPGESGMDYGNNHTHIAKFQGQYYIMYHSQNLQHLSKIRGGFRSLMIDSLQVDENVPSIALRGGTKRGVAQIKPLNPREKVAATTMCNSADIWYQDIEDPEAIATLSLASGAWVAISQVDFQRPTRRFTAMLRGEGSVEVRIDSADGPTIAVLESSAEEAEISDRLIRKVHGVHDLYILFSDKDMTMKSWQFR